MADQYNRQLHPNEIPLLEKQSSSLAQEANISPAEAEKRLAQALAYYTDNNWNNALAAKGVVPDALTLKHLGIALSPLADSYAAVGDVPVVAGSKSYTPAETVALITEYRNTHTAEYADPSINNLNMQGAYAGDPEYKYADFYRKNLAVNTGFLSAVSGNLAGIAQGSGGALSDSLGSAWALMSDPVGVSEQAANGLMGLSKNPWGSFKNSVEASQTKEAMATIYDMQGNTAASAAIRAKSDLEFALNFLPANRAKTLAELGGGVKATASKNLNPTGALTDSEAGTLVEREVLGSGAKGGAALSNDVLVEARIGNGTKGQGSGNKVDQLPNKQVVGADGKPIPVYSELEKPNGPYAIQEFPSTPVAHGFPDIVDNYANSATKFPLNNGSSLYQASGSYNGVVGRFEWIVDPKLGGVTHRMFVPNGTVNGIPVKP